MQLKNYGYTHLFLVQNNLGYVVKKQLVIKDVPYIKLFKNEQSFCNKLKHKNIIDCLKFDEDNIFFEYAFFKDLNTFMYQNKMLFLEYRDYFVKKIVEGLEYLHSLNIVHNDLKLDNLLITKEKKLKISDFGLTQYEGSDFFEQMPDYIFQGTYSVNKPKKFSKKPEKSEDIYALGMILYEMYTFKNPTYKEINFELIENSVIKIVVSEIKNKNILTINDILLLFKTLNF